MTMKQALPRVLSFNGGYVDTAGFLALQGLFTAHVTGNFVTLGAALALGTSGAVAKLSALPLFCGVVILTRLLSLRLERRGVSAVRPLLLLKLLLLAGAAALALTLGPFTDGDGWAALGTGMVLVTAMAIQNALHRIHLGGAPPTTLMTGNTTQIMIDLADLLRGGMTPDARTATLARLSALGGAVAAFALGCAAAAGLYAAARMLCFLVPPLLALGALLLARRDA